MNQITQAQLARELSDATAKAILLTLTKHFKLSQLQAHFDEVIKSLSGDTATLVVNILNLLESHGIVAFTSEDQFVADMDAEDQAEAEP